jgi:hypothetical protein
VSEFNLFSHFSSSFTLTPFSVQKIFKILGSNKNNLIFGNNFLKNKLLRDGKQKEGRERERERMIGRAE